MVSLNTNLMACCALVLTAAMASAQADGPRATSSENPNAGEDAHSLYMPTGPAPEEGYEPYRVPLSGEAQKLIADVPGYGWRHGCGPTAAGMVIGYWDGQGAASLIPGDASYQTYAVNQAIATGNGSNTHYSDYSLPLDYMPGPIQPDKSETGGAHASDCLADFMNTSWSARNNYYGWSWFSDVDDSLRDYTDWANTTYGTSYTCISWNQSWGDFTWAKFMAEIDADRPMVFLVDTDGDRSTDHFVTAIGYRDVMGYPEYACLDTWSPAGSVRWERFRGLASGNDWGIYGATYYWFLGPFCNEDGTCDPNEHPCGCPVDCGPLEEPNELTCDDGVDNDCDGLADCQDKRDCCFDDDVCTYDGCVGDVCQHTARRYGDINGDGTSNVFDIFCQLDVVAGADPLPEGCDASNADIEPCIANGTVNVFDMIEVLAAIAGDNTCDCSEGPP